MVADRRPCLEVLDQLGAANGALRAAAEQVAMAGVRDCLDTWKVASTDESVDDWIVDALAILHRLGAR